VDRLREERRGVGGIVAHRLRDGDDTDSETLAQQLLVATRALVPLTQSAPTLAAFRSTPELAIPLELYREAGFTRAPEKPESILDALGELAAELQRHAGILHGLATEASEHPARHFARHSQRVLGAVCRFELARNLRREGPVMRASETLVGELLQDRLAPLLRELIAATVRFEWYFKPLEIPEETRKLTLGGSPHRDPTSTHA
jgi:hypothetical protein